MSQKISSRNIQKRVYETLIVKVSSNADEDEKFKRQLLAMARVSHPDKQMEDIKQELVDDEWYWTICIGEARIGRDFNPSVYGPTVYVEDLID